MTYEAVPPLHCSWPHLSAQVLQLAQRWQTFWTETLTETSETLDMEDGSASHVVFIWHLLWLIPLAEVLQQHSKLHSLVPVVHHAVLDLRFTSGSQERSISLYSPVPGTFRATLVTTFPPDPNTVAMGEGDAATVAHLIEKYVEVQL